MRIELRSSFLTLCGQTDSLLHQNIVSVDPVFLAKGLD